MVSQMQNVKTFTIDKNTVTITAGSMLKLNAVKELHQAITEKSADAVTALWRTSNSMLRRLCQMEPLWDYQKVQL